MISTNTMTTAMYNQGKADALDLRSRAVNMTGTEIIDEESKIPAFDTKKDYSKWIKDSPVKDEGQVWILLSPYNAAKYDEHRPSTLRAHWGLCHTKDPYKAKPWVDAYGISGMYMTDECYLAEDGTVYRAKQDNLVHDAAVYPDGWEAVIL